MKDVLEYNLLSNNTFGIGETCRRFVEFGSVAELKDVVRGFTDADKPLLIIGGGSNLLLTGRYDGTVVRSAIKGVEVTDEGESVLLRCGSGECFDDIVAMAVVNGWYGAENLSIIPGDVGASAVQNIGAYGREVKDIIVSIEAIRIADGEECEFLNEDCQYAYRQSRFKNEWKDKYIITYVTYRLQKTFTAYTQYGNIQAELDKRGISEPTAKDVREVIIDIRNAKLPDPKVEGNAGSFFMNPIVTKAKYEELLARYPQMPHYKIDDEHEKIPAGWMIDQCGWKGKGLSANGEWKVEKTDGAAVHKNQALVLVNKGGASGKDVVALCEAIRQDVKNTFGVDIHPEVNVV